jgi:hypothetical protein
MAKLIVRHRVANFESWKSVFDGMTELRKRHGFTGHTLVRDAADPSVVTIINEVKDLAGAKAYGGSPELRDAMARGGVQGPPEVFFCEEQEARTY